MRLPHWGAKHRDKSVLRLLPGLLATLIPLAILLLLPTLILLVSGRVVNYELLFAYLPGIMLILSVGAILNLVKLVGRVLILARRDRTEP